MKYLTKYQNYITGFLILLFAAVLIFSIYRDYKNYKDGYTCDLRKRIVGVRYMAKGYSPYFFKWTPAYPPELCIQYEGDSTYKQNIVTLPPSYSWLLQPLAKMQFPVIEKVWFAFQYTSLLLIFALFYFKCDNKKTQHLLLLLYTLLLLSKGWIRNMDIGQSYMLFPLILSMMYIFLHQKKQALFYYGIIIGVCIWLRPSFIFFVLPFLFADKKQLFFKGLFAAAAVCILQVFLFNHFQNWIDFFKSSGYWVSYYSQKNFDNGAGFDHLVYPPVIENQTNFSITNLPDYIANIPINLRAICNIYASTTMYTILFLIITIALLISLFYKKKIQDHTVLLLAGFCFYYLSGIFMWIPKYSYYFVELFFPLCLLIYNQQKANTKILLIAFTGLFFSAYLFRLIPMQLLIGEYLIAAAFLLYLFTVLKKAIHN